MLTGALWWLLWGGQTVSEVGAQEPGESGGSWARLEVEEAEASGWGDPALSLSLACWIWEGKRGPGISQVVS